MSNNKYYEEPSEFEEKCLELVQMIKDNATQELKTELEQLREENAKMKDIITRQFFILLKIKPFLYGVRRIERVKPNYKIYKIGWGEITFNLFDNFENEKFYNQLEYYFIKNIYDGEGFESIKDCEKTYFRDKDTAQRYADWLNERVEEGKCQ